MASAGKSKGTSQEDKVHDARQARQRLEGHGRDSRSGAGGSGDPEAPDDVDYVRPAGEGDVERGRSHEEHKRFGDRSDT